jgi:hypothetical protein
VSSWGSKPQTVARKFWIVEVEKPVLEFPTWTWRPQEGLVWMR